MSSRAPLCVPLRRNEGEGMGDLPCTAGFGGILERQVTPRY